MFGKAFFRALQFFAACGKTKKPSLRIRTTCAVVPPYFTDYSALFPRLRRAAVPVTAVVFPGADSSSFSRGKALFVSVSMETCPLSAAGRQERIFSVKILYRYKMRLSSFFKKKVTAAEHFNRKRIFRAPGLIFSCGQPGILCGGSPPWRISTVKFRRKVKLLDTPRGIIILYIKI